MKETDSGTVGGVVGNSAEDVARANWNSEADEYNQWDSLGQDEKDELIASAPAVRPAIAGTHKPVVGREVEQ